MNHDSSELYPPGYPKRNAVEQTDIAYQEVKDVVTIGRGVGLWGDMVGGDLCKLCMG